MKITELSPEQAILKEFGVRLSQLRKQQGLSQDRLAQEAGIGVATLRRIEDGQDSQLSSWLKLMKALQQVSALDEFLPEQLVSPMAEVRAQKRKSRGKAAASKAGIWGDEASDDRDS